MPLRREIVDLDAAQRRPEALRAFGLDPDRPVLLVFGGSLGARRLNAAIGDAWRDVTAAGWQVLHAVGGTNELPSPADGYTPVAYLDRMDLAFAAADLIVCRSGAATVSEISALGIPAVYVPYAVGNGEQALNARAAIDAGAARCIADAEFTGERVRSEIVPLLGDAEALASMRRAAGAVGTRSGTEGVVALIDRASTA